MFSQSSALVLKKLSASSPPIAAKESSLMSKIFFSERMDLGMHDLDCQSIDPGQIIIYISWDCVGNTDGSYLSVLGQVESRVLVD